MSTLYNSTSVYSFSLGFAPDGDVLSANDSVNGNWNYSYDQFNRLVCSNLVSNGTCPASGTPTYSYVYDRFGNRWQQNGPYTFTASFTGNATNNNNRMDLHSYDTAGNLLYDGTHYYFYDAENRLIQVDGTLGTCASGSTTGTTACYYYDAEGHRVHRTGIGDDDCLNDGNGGVADFAFDLDGHWTFRTNSTGGGCSSEIYIAGRHFGSVTDGDVFFDHTDWLGTARLRNISAYPTSQYETCTSLPFGDGLSCNSTYASNIHFTGKEHDFETGLDNFGARFDASNFGRFMSPDPSGMDLANTLDPQQLNLYSYVRNNPLTFTDPFGLDCAYLNNAGNAIESVDTNSSGGECQGMGGYWVSGQVNQVTVNDNGTYNFGYSGIGPDGNLQSITYNNYVSPLPPGTPNIPSQCGYDLRCDSQGNILGMARNMESANGTNFMIGGLFGAGIKLGAGLLGGLFDAGAENTTNVIFEQGLGHGARHLAGTGLQQAAVEKAITAEIQKTVAGSTATGNFWGKVVVDGQTVVYRAFTLPNGTINVGTYTVGAP